jgi:prepilin-type N-terminal cleavage/methylation domain-containing protein
MKKERGFTLIELLVVIAILAVLFGVTALALTNVGNNAETEIQQAELDVVQTAVDVCDTLSSCTITPNTGTAEQVGPATSGFGSYLRRTSEYYYCWDANDLVTQQTSAGACP